MAKEDVLVLQGKVVEALSNNNLRVKLLDVDDTEVIAHIAGRLRRNFIKIIPGDIVTVELSPYDLNKGRITYRQNRRDA